MSTVEQQAALEMLRGYFSEEDGAVRGLAATLIAWLEELQAENETLKNKIAVLLNSEPQHFGIFNDPAPNVAGIAVCPECLGHKRNFRGDPCERCHGSGRVFYKQDNAPDEPTRLVPSPGSHSVVF